MVDAAKLGRELFQLARRCVHDYGVKKSCFVQYSPEDRAFSG